MNRGEGMWHYEGKIHVRDTSGGSASRGTVWEPDLVQQSLKCIYACPGNLVGNMGDNLTVSQAKACCCAKTVALSLGTVSASDSA